MLLAVDDEPLALTRIEDELRRRYECDYTVLCERSLLAALEALRGSRHDVAVVLADQWMPEMSGAEASRAGRGSPPAREARSSREWGAWGDRATAEAIRGAMARGEIDYYVL